MKADDIHQALAKSIHPTHQHEAERSENGVGFEI